MASELREAIEKAYSYTLSPLPKESLKFKTMIDVNSVLDAVIAALPEIEPFNGDEDDVQLGFKGGQKAYAHRLKSILEEAKK